MRLEKASMSIDKLNDDRLDEILRRTLRAHLPPSSANFTEKVLKQIRAAEKQWILARIIWQERFALASCIAVAIAGIVAAVIFAAIDGGFTLTVQLLIYGISQTIQAFSSQWQLYTILAGVLVFVGYSLVDLLVGD
jgi:ABC-type microcin C transport system permease subunit YejE